VTERELERRAQRRLAVLPHVEEVSGNVAATCRYYGISRQCYYGWLRRFEADGLDGLTDRSQRPAPLTASHPSRHRGEIIWLRQHYHSAQPRSPCTWPATTTSRSASRGLADPQAVGAEPATRLAVLPTSSVALETLREAQLNGKAERSHRIGSEEFYRLLEGQVIDDANLFSEKLQEWEDYYNYYRPHGALSGQTPYERLRQKTQDPLS
jgi:transposase-like protein